MHCAYTCKYKKEEHLIKKNEYVSCDFDKFRVVDNHLCQLRGTPAARLHRCILLRMHTTPMDVRVNIINKVLPIIMVATVRASPQASPQDSNLLRFVSVNSIILKKYSRNTTSTATTVPTTYVHHHKKGNLKPAKKLFRNKKTHEKPTCRGQGDHLSLQLTKCTFSSPKFSLSMCSSSVFTYIKTDKSKAQKTATKAPKDQQCGDTRNRFFKTRLSTLEPHPHGGFGDNQNQHTSLQPEEQM